MTNPFISTKDVIPEGTIGHYGQKFIMQNGQWVPMTKAWFKVEGQEKEINKKRKATKQKKQEKAQEKLDEIKQIDLGEYSL